MKSNKKDADKPDSKEGATPFKKGFQSGYFAVVSSSTLATAAGGALIGTAIGGPVGSVIGAVSGASVSVVASAVESHTKASKAEEEDDA